MPYKDKEKERQRAERRRQNPRHRAYQIEYQKTYKRGEPKLKMKEAMPIQKTLDVPTVIPEPMLVNPPSTDTTEAPVLKEKKKAKKSSPRNTFSKEDLTAARQKWEKTSAKQPFPRKMPGTDTTFSSLWSYNPLAEELFKDKLSEKGFSEFSPFVAKSIVSYWSEHGDTVLDPFAGRTRGIVTALMGRKYIGYEVSKEAFDSVMGEINKMVLSGVDIRNEDSINIKDLDITADLIFSCPPYWDLEKYESVPGQLSDLEDYGEFMNALKQRVEAAWSKLKPGGYATFVVGDWRKGEGSGGENTYIKFHMDFIKMAEEIGMKLHDLVVLQNVAFGVGMIRFGASRKHKFTSKVHEYLLIFKK